MESKLFELDAKRDALRAKTAGFPARVTKDFQERLDISWIFHEHALEGVVLSYSELKAAVDQRIISDVTLIPMYEEVRSHKQAVDFVREASAQKKRPEVDLELLKRIARLHVVVYDVAVVLCAGESCPLQDCAEHRGRGPHCIPADSHAGQVVDAIEPAEIRDYPVERTGQACASERKILDCQRSDLGRLRQPRAIDFRSGCGEHARGVVGGQQAHGPAAVALVAHDGLPQGTGVGQPGGDVGQDRGR